MKTTTNPFADGTTTLPKAKRRRTKPVAPAPTRRCCGCNDTALVGSNGWCVECFDRGLHQQQQQAKHQRKFVA